MTATVEPPAVAPEAPTRAQLSRAEGVELLGAVNGSGYKEGAALVRRSDGQMVQLGALMYALLDEVDGQRSSGELAHALSERHGRRFKEAHVDRLAEKLARQGLLGGTEHRAPPRRNPLLALRWKVLVTNPAVTKRLTAPFTFLFRPWLMWPVLAGFAGVFWFVLFHKGVASATAQAFHNPGLLLLVFVLAVTSAGFHELGHASACRYGGGTPGGMGMGLYLVWPAFYTDVTDSYRLPKRARLRVDLGGLYFNAVVAVITMGVWLLWHVDALLLLIALQVLQMVKQLSPVIRADGYHILSDATGVPDLYSHMGPTLRRLLPGHRKDPTALTGWARLVVTLWVLIVVPVLLSLTFSAVLLFPKLATTAWESGRHIAQAIPHQVSDGQIIDVLASVVRLLALFLPVLGSALVTQKIVRTMGGKARAWSAGSLPRRVIVIAAGTALVGLLAWAWWPSGQYQPVRATDNGTLSSMVRLVTSPSATARPAPAPAQARLAPGTHLAVAMIPVGGASRSRPALFVVPGAKGRPAVAVLSDSAPNPASARSATGTAQATGGSTTSVAPGSTNSAGSTTPAAGGGAVSKTPIQATAFPFKLPSAPGPGGTQAVAVGTKSGGVVYDVAYSLVTVTNGAPVTNTNSAYALANCKSCTTVAVSFQVVLVVGQSNRIAPINAAGALNYDCPACNTTAIADQLVITLRANASPALLSRLEDDLRELNVLPELGAGGSPSAVASEVAAVQQQIDTQLSASGLPTNPIQSSAGTTGSSGSSANSATNAGSPGSTSSTGGSSPGSPAGSTSEPGSDGYGVIADEWVGIVFLCPPDSESVDRDHQHSDRAVPAELKLGNELQHHKPRARLRGSFASGGGRWDSRCTRSGFGGWIACGRSGAWPTMFC